ncbi:streptomycin 3-adenylyltransferase [Rhodococcus triatomae]|uniref:Streptomycin 3-adenylyltransferase n=1 Tax=Rhodococcus triatomae TaxID=300028 RepID=A0A1G8K3R5_9NOCA|nr:aminoglycoside adenylyltransferase family protein [Rhodococcus triatomae]SDI38051.1 streptomycin 3-adenylyltransferase [Rhodococcus triatomae]
MSDTSDRDGPGISAEAKSIARQVLELVRGLLGSDDVAGTYLYGSAVHGGLGPHSDVDVFVVSRRPTTRRERHSLVHGLMTLSGSGTGDAPGRPVELTVAVLDEIRPWRYPPRRDFQYGEWLRDEFERGHTPDPALDPDLAVLTTMVLHADTALSGLPPGELLAPVPRSDLGRASAATLPALLAELHTDTRNVVLTLARIWTTLATGEIRSKDAAATWALDRLPEQHRPVPRRARAIYLGEEEERWADLAEALAPYAEHVTRAIERLATQ